MTTAADVTAPAREPYGQLSLPFGFLAWRSPMAQIAMIRRELADEEHWVTGERFNWTLALYSALMQGSWCVDIILSL
jgi:chromate transporter